MGVTPSCGSVGNAYDDAMADSISVIVERELLNRYRFKTKTEALLALFEWIQGCHYPYRLHLPLKYFVTS